jgi:hypothetical protein
MASQSTSSARLSYPVSVSARVRASALDRVNAALTAVFLLVATFFFWRTTVAEPLALHGGQGTPYNQLADAFIHLHVWVVHVPAAALSSGNPYNPAERSPFLFGYPDYALYGHYLYLTWGAAPVLVLLVPLHLLGFEPSASVISMPYAIVGLGFALATLRVILRRIGEVSLWMCILAGLTLACASAIPYIVRFPLVYHEEIAGGYCFAMAGIWFAVSAVVDQRRSSLKRLALMSLCIGLAADTRPTLGLIALVLVAVYAALRSTRERRGLLFALAAPFGACVALLLAYNYVRFGDPLQYGAKYQINGISTYTAHFGSFSYLPPGLWSYLIAPPRVTALFPFFLLNAPQASYPLGLPAHYTAISEETGGLLPMAPIALFVVALPWVWRRRPAVLGPVAPLLLALVCAGLICMVFVSYEFYISTERYEADYMTLLLLGALAAWLVLSSQALGRRRRRLVRTLGALLAAWSCVTGMAGSYQEIAKDPGTWRTLVNLGSPLSTAIATIAGHPVLAEIHTRNQWASLPSYSNLGTEVTGFWLNARDHADLTIVSPDTRQDTLVANTFAGPALEAGTSPEVLIAGAEHASHVYRLPGAGGLARIPVHLSRGVNQLVLVPVAGAAAHASASEYESQPESEAESEAESGSGVLMAFKQLHLAGG